MEGLPSATSSAARRVARAGPTPVFITPDFPGMADRRLQVFHAVAKHRSFTKAAEALYMTQPAVTFQVKQLEEQFNARLFDRSHGRISLTSAGELVLDYAERILKLSAELEARMAETSGEIAGPLAIGASLTNGEFILPQVIGEFQALYPRVQILLSVGNSELIESRVADRTLDLGFIESPSHLANLATEDICEDELVVICAPGSGIARLRRAEPVQLVEHPYVRREPGSGTREFADRYLRSQGISPDDLHVVMELGSTVAIKSVVETGLGYSLMSRAAIVKELRLGTLVAIALEPRLIRILSWVSVKEQFRPRRLESFVEFATGKMRQMAGGWRTA
jgi:DNA-binding transcriptional LysR family regulator